MPDNTRGGSESGTAPLIASDEVTYSGDTASVQLVRLVETTGSEGSKTVVPLVTGVQYLEDGALGASGQGTFILARRDNVLSTLSEAEGDAVGLRVDGQGSLWASLSSLPMPHLAGGITTIKIGSAFTTQQTSANLIAGTAGQRIYVTSITIATGGTTAGRVSIYWGTGTFTAGTSVTLFDGEFVPSTNSKPGAVLSFSIPIGGASATGDSLKITTSAAMTVYVSGQAYKV